MTRRGSLRLVFAAMVALHLVALGIQVMNEGKLSQNPLRLRVERLLSGRLESLAQIADERPLLVVFWATWCVYCAKELEDGADLADRLSAGSVPVGVLFVNVREHESTVVNHPATENLETMIGLDPTGEVSRAFGVRGYPSWVLLGAHGEVLWFEEGLGASIEREVAIRVGGGGNGVE